MKTLTFVTGNSGKFKEVSHILSPEIELFQSHIELIEQQTLDIREIAKHKAQQAFTEIKKPVLVDDTGMYFDAYNQFPGVLAKFAYLGLGLKGLEKLLSGDTAKTGYALTILAYMDETLSEPVLFEGKVHGRFDFSYLEEIDNSQISLPYNYIFVPDGFSEPVYKVYDERHHGKSQRSIAATKIKEFFLNK